MKDKVRKSSQENQPAVCVRLDKDMYEWLRLAAKNEVRSITAQVRYYIKKGLLSGQFPETPK